MKTPFLAKQFAVTKPLDVNNKLAVVAVQLALGRLGYLQSRVDGSLGPKSQAAVREFQEAHALPQTGDVDAATLTALDAAHDAKDFRSPAAKAKDPIAFLSDFAALGLPRLLANGAIPQWNDAVTQAAFGAFCKHYWAVMKANTIEADCKTIALFLMEQFRKKAKLDTGRELAMPGRNGRRLDPLVWTWFTADDAKGFFSKVNGRPLRREYKSARLVEAVMVDHSMIFGVNLSVNIKCAQVAERVHRISQRKAHNRGDHRAPEIEIDDLAPGRLIFMDHDGAKGFDHAITVIEVTRVDGKVRQVVLAVGSYDDVTDSDPTTPVKGKGSVNNYAEEVTIDFDEHGKVVDPNAAPTWASEPRYLREPEYTAKNTIMDNNARAQMIVARWGDAK